MVTDLLVTLVLNSCPRCMGGEFPLDSDLHDLRVIASDNDGSLHLLTTDIVGPCRQRRYVRSADGGRSWSPDSVIALDPSYQGCATTEELTIYSDGKRVYVPFAASDTTNWSTLWVLKISPDRGASWPPVTVPVAPLSSSPVTYAKVARIVALLDGRAWFFWVDGAADPTIHAYVSRSTDGGMTWGAPIAVDPGAAPPLAGLWADRLADGTLIALLQTSEGAGGRLYFTRSESDGVSWAAPVAIDGLAAPTWIEGGPLLTWPSGNVLVVWRDERAGQRDVFARTSPDGGLTWPDPPVRVDIGDPPGTSESATPQVVHSGPGLEVTAVWGDRRTRPHRMFANVSLDGGRTWGVPAGADAAPISAAVTDGYIGSWGMAGGPEGWLTVLWRDGGRDGLAVCGNTSCPAVYGTTSCDGGISWEPDRLVVDTAHKPNTVLVGDLPDGAAGLVFNRSGIPFDWYLRMDGPTVAHAQGPTTYCLGNDPPLEAGAVSAGCPGGLALQWYVDGVLQPGAVQPTFQPALPAGDHVVDVRGTCAADPTCTPAWVPITLRVRGPIVPPDVGNNLLAARAGVDVVLDWSRAPVLPDVHAHVRRADGKGQPFTLVAPDPLPPRSYRDSPPLTSPLWLYDVRQADVCETESAN